MKYYLTITTTDIPDEDQEAWDYLYKLFNITSSTENDIFKNFREEVYKQFPVIPHKIVFGNYLLGNIHEHYLNFDIDTRRAGEIISFIRQLAAKRLLVIFDPQDDIIYRPIP